MSLIAVMEEIVTKRTDRIERSEARVAKWSEKVRSLNEIVDTRTEAGLDTDGQMKTINFYQDSIKKESERITTYQQRNEEDLAEIESFKEG